MMSPREFLTTPTGQLMLVGLLAAGAGGAVYWQQARRPAPLPPPVATASVATTPRTSVRDVVPFQPPTREVSPTPATPASQPMSVTPVGGPPVLPLSLSPVRIEAEPRGKPVAPYGRLIPCETVLTLESNRLETPVIGLVTEDVWHEGRLVVPKGAEVHGRAATDRARERLAAQGAWKIVWRAPGTDNGTELDVQGIALDRDRDESTGLWGLHDGSAGLRGQVLASNDWREVQLFAATFLSTATLALQDTRTTAGVLGDTVTPAATARNAGLAGTSAVLRDYARQIREAIERDGIYVRVPAGKPFYLYVTQTLDRSRRAPSDHAN
jgi:hypothetical protein